jgi:hypothetical protein
MKRGCELDLKYVNGAERPDGSSMDFYTFRAAMREVAEITLDGVATYLPTYLQAEEEIQNICCLYVSLVR